MARIAVTLYTMGRERTMKKMTLKKATAGVLAWSLLGTSAGQPAWAAGAKVVEVVPASFSGNGLGGISAGGAAVNRIDALNLLPLLSQLSLQQLSVLHSEPLKTQPLVAQLMALQVQPIAALASFKASDDPANAALYRILGHPDAIAGQRDALVPVIGQENFQKLLTTAKEINKLAGQNSALREALSSGENPAAALQRFKEHFDGAGELVAGLGNTAVVSGVGSGLKSPPSGL
ncbi:MAG: hypothetical protein AAB322_06955, partial [Pseudomonadota bacterium]